VEAGMTRYATGTEVPADRTRLEIERLLAQRGADQWAAGWEAGRALLAFRLTGRQVRMTLPMPDRADFTDYTAGNGRRVSGQRAYDAELRRRWRALLLVIMAKLTAIDDGISTVEREFLADMVTTGGRTVAEELAAGGLLEPRGELYELDGGGR
jgi:hypothetical protein